MSGRVANPWVIGHDEQIENKITRIFNEACDFEK